MQPALHSSAPAPIARVCHCGACRLCQETARFIERYERLHGAEEQAYYAEPPDERSQTGSSSAALAEASIYAFGRPRERHTKGKHPAC